MTPANLPSHQEIEDLIKDSTENVGPIDCECEDVFYEAARRISDVHMLARKIRKLFEDKLKPESL